MILDTDVLIWYFKGNAGARSVIEESLPFSISAITAMELMQGARNKAKHFEYIASLKLRVFKAN